MTRLRMLAMAALVAMASAVTATAVMTTGVLALDAAGEGRRLYLRLNCYGCHGMEGQGGMARALRQRNLSASYVTIWINSGPNGMPVYRGQVSPTDISNITAYLNSIGTPSEPTFNRWWQKNPRG